MLGYGCSVQFPLTFFGCSFEFRTCVGSIVIARGEEADPEVHPHFLR